MINHFMQQYNFGHEAPMAPLADSTLIEQTVEVEIPARQTGLYRDNPNPEYLGAMQMVVTDTDKYVKAIPAIDGSSDEGGEGGQESGGTESGSTEPVEEESTAYDYVYDEASWNASEANGALKKYHEKYPEEDWWNNAANRACNYNDRVYEGTVDSVNVVATAGWASEAAQSITIDNVTYYGAIFYGFDAQDIELFNDVALTESAGKTFAITSIHYSDDCGRSWQGAINNPGAQYPWICPNFADEEKAQVIFRYEGSDDIKPWGDKEINWGCESVAKLYGDEFDIEKFKMIIIH